MGLLDNIGPYSETTITTRESDVEVESDNKNPVAQVLIGLFLFCVSIPTIWFMGLILWNYIGPILPFGIIGLGFWCCSYYGTSRSITGRFRYRMTKEQCIRIKRRLSDIKENGL